MHYNPPLRAPLDGVAYGRELVAIGRGGPGTHEVVEMEGIARDLVRTKMGHHTHVIIGGVVKDLVGSCSPEFVEEGVADIYGGAVVGQNMTSCALRVLGSEDDVS